MPTLAQLEERETINFEVACSNQAGQIPFFDLRQGTQDYRDRISSVSYNGSKPIENLSLTIRYAFFLGTGNLFKGWSL